MSPVRDGGTSLCQRTFFRSSGAYPYFDSDSTVETVGYYRSSLMGLWNGVRRVESLFALADQIEARLSAAQWQVDKLTPSFLAHAFAGQLVLQEPDDEPATELLNPRRRQAQCLERQRKRTPLLSHRCQNMFE